MNCQSSNFVIPTRISGRRVKERDLHHYSFALFRSVARANENLKFRDGEEKDLSPCLVFSPFFHRRGAKFRKTPRQRTIKISSPCQDWSRYVRSFFQDI